MSVRARQLSVAAAAAAALAAGIAVGARDEDAPERSPEPGPAPTATATAAAARPRRPALERDAGRLVVLRFAGPVVPAYVERALRAGRAAGVILFRDNVRDPAQLRALTARLRRASGGRALVMTDQEGGEVRIVPWAGPERSAAAQAAAGTVRADAQAAARTLRAGGVNVTLAPVADVATVPGSALAGRGFSTDAGAAADAVADSVAGWRSGAVASTLKHFPGLGGATENTDDAPVDVAGEPDLEPFRAGVRAGAPLVMLSHARYPALDPDRIASQSRRIVDGLLRDELGFRGVAVTDSLEAAAATATGTVEATAERSVRAGVDLILTTGPGSSLRVYRRLLAVARRSPAFEARVRVSARRVVRLQRSLAR